MTNTIVFCRTRAALCALAAFAVWCGSLSVCAAQDAASVFERVRKQYGETESLQAKFSTTLPGTGETLGGTLSVKRGNKFRLDMNDRTVSCNGKTVWNHDKQQNKVVVSTFKNNPATISPEKLFLTFPKAYRPALKREIGEEGSLLRLTLEPADERDAVAGMRRVVLRLKPESLLLRELIISDGSGEYHWNIGELKLNAGLKDAFFEGKTPQGAQIIDLRD